MENQTVRRWKRTADLCIFVLVFIFNTNVEYDDQTATLNSEMDLIDYLRTAKDDVVSS